MKAIQSLIESARTLVSVDEEKVVGYCPECGAEIQRQDRTTIKTITGRYASGYRCPYARGGRKWEDVFNSFGAKYCTHSSMLESRDGMESEFLYETLKKQEPPTDKNPHDVLGV